MEKDEKDKSAPLLHVRTAGQRATSSERVGVIQTNTPAGQDANSRSANLTRVVSSSASDMGNKPIKRIGAADLEKILGAGSCGRARTDAAPGVIELIGGTDISGGAKK